MTPIERKLTQARTNLVLEQPFFGVLALRLPIRSDTTTSTFCTNGKEIKYNPEFVEKLSIAQIQGIICHEILHVSNGHCWRRDARDSKRWNYAADYAINPIILDNNMILTDDALVDSRFTGMATEQIYSILQQEPEKEGDGEPTFGEVEDDIGGDKDVNETEWRVATLHAAQAAQAQGKLPVGLERLIKDLKASKVDWKAALRRFMQHNLKADYRWTQPNRRYIASGLYLPIMQSESIPTIVNYWDSSGSRDTDEARAECAGEVSAIISELQPEKTYVIYGDFKVQRVDIFEQGDPVTFNPVGGGGTDFRPIFEYIKEQGIEPTCFIGITDLQGDFPDNGPDYPVLWAKTTDIDPPFGESVKIKL